MKKSHSERVLDYMNNFGSISSLEAFRDLGVTRLSAVIFNLKKAGYNITSNREKSINRYGDTTYFARYRLE